MRHGLGEEWSAEHDAELQRLLAEKFSFSQAASAITRKFGIERSRNSCIGRARRNGWRYLCSKGEGAKRAARYGHLKLKAVRITHPPKLPSEPTFRAQRIELRSAPVEPLNVTLLELETGQCRYPFGDGPFVFCGHQALTGGPYCGPHAALTLNPDQRFDHKKRTARCFAEAAE